MTKWAEVQLCRLLHNEFRPDPSTFYLVIVTDLTDRQTDRPTPVKTQSLVFAGVINERVHLDDNLGYVNLQVITWA